MTTDPGLSLTLQQERVNGRSVAANIQTTCECHNLRDRRLSVNLMSSLNSSSVKHSRRREQHWGVGYGERKGGREVTLDIECTCHFIVQQSCDTTKT